MHHCPNTTPGPWKLILHGNEREPLPLSIHTTDDQYWIARDGSVSSEANARLIAAAPLMYEALANLENDDAERMPPSAWKLVQDALAAARGETE